MAKLIRMSEAAEPIADLPSAVDEVYSFLGPSGTFTEAALALRTHALALGVSIDQLAQDLVRAMPHESSNDA